MPRSDLQGLTVRGKAFREARDWGKFHNPKDVALSLVLEAAEVLEHMQWKDADELRRHLAARKEDFGDELADVLYWLLILADDQGIDLAQAFERKMLKNEAKYPVEKVKGKAIKYRDL